MREQNLLAMRHHMQHVSVQSVPQSSTQAQKILQQAGYRTQTHEKENGQLISAKKGAANKLGYILAHGAIVLIAIGVC